MALFAVGSEVILVGVVVAIVAVFEGDICKFLKRLAVSGLFPVAIDTLHRFVSAHQRKVRFIVVKLGGGGKFFCRMAFGTVIPQGFLVDVFVAGSAFVVQPQKRVFPFLQIGICHII